MSELTCQQVYTVGRSERRSVTVDYGENTAGSETGALKAGDTLSSVTASTTTKPSGAADPTLGSPSVNGTAVYVNGRSCSAGEAVSMLVTQASDQTYGRYVVTMTGTTTNGEIIPRKIVFNVAGE
jgi:hypothetical protein